MCLKVCIFVHVCVYGDLVSCNEVSVMQINQMNFARKWVMEKIDMHIYMYVLVFVGICVSESMHFCTCVCYGDLVSCHEVSVMQINQMNFVGYGRNRHAYIYIYIYICVCMCYYLWVFVCLKLCIFVHVGMVIGELS